MLLSNASKYRTVWRTSHSEKWLVNADSVIFNFFDYSGNKHYLKHTVAAAKILMYYFMLSGGISRNIGEKYVSILHW